MSTYPPNQTTPKSGNYLWNWLGSPLKKFAAALAPYLGGGGGDGYTYTEINISSADLINPPVTSIGNTGAVLLPEAPVDQYYEWKMNVEFIPGSTPYNATPPPGVQKMNVWGSWGTWPSIEFGDLTTNRKLVWRLDSRANYQTPDGGIYNDTPTMVVGDNYQYLGLVWGPGFFTGGDGTLKVKLWYKLVNFG